MVPTIICGVLVLGFANFNAEGGLVITLEARNLDGESLATTVEAGTQAQIDVALSVDAADAPLSDLRGLQFDFSGTSTSITVDSFEWSVNSTAYSFVTNTLPTVAAITLMSSGSPMLLALTDQPVLVATVDITIDGTGVLDLRNPDSPDTNTAAWFRAGFATTKEFSLFDENLSGGTISFTVAGTTDPGSGDGGGAGGNGGGDMGGGDPANGGDTGGNTGGTDTGGSGGSTDVGGGGTGGGGTDAGGTGGSDVGVGTGGTDGSGGIGGTDAGGNGGSTDGGGDGSTNNGNQNDNGSSQNPPTSTPRLCGVGILFPILFVWLGLCGMRLHLRRIRPLRWPV